MNERIRELAEQVEKWIKTTNFEGMPEDDMTYEEIFNKKFAELIVRECMMLVEGFESTQEVALDEYVDYEASAVLKEHFGVES